MLDKIINGAEILPITAVIIRTIILYIAVIIATRIMGKRQVGIISGHNYLVAAGLVSLVAVRMVNPKTSIISGIIIVFTYAGFNWLWSYLDLKLPNFVDRKPLVLMEDGVVLAKNLSRAQITIDEFLMELRSQKIWNLSVIQQAILEPTGDLTILKR